MLAYMLLLTAADLQIILALLGSLDFDLKPTVKHGNSFIVPTPLMITFLARAGGVPAVGVRAVDCWQRRSGHYNHQSFLFFFPFFFFSFFFLRRDLFS